MEDKGESLRGADNSATVKKSFFKRMMTYFTVSDMTEGSPYKKIIIFAVPLLLGNILQQLYNTVDTIVVGQFQGHQAMVAVGSGGDFMLFLSSFFVGIGLGAMVIISQYMGAKKYEDLSRAVSTIYKAMFYGVIPLTLVGVIIVEPILRALNVPGDALGLSVIYLRVIFVGLVGQMGYYVNMGLFQGLGDSVSSLVFLSIATVLNIILDIVLGVFFNMGVLGVSIATVISQFISWVLGLISINKRYPYLKFNLLKLQFDPSIFKRAVKLGIPSGIQQSVFALGMLVFSYFVNSQGSVFAAGFRGASKIDTLVFLPVQSISIAITTFVAQNLGARRTERVKQGAKTGLVLSLAVSLVIGLALLPFSESAMYAFNSEPGVVAAGGYYLKTILPTFFLLAAMFAINSVLRGVGKNIIPMFSTLISLWLVRIPISNFILNNYGNQYIYISYPIGWALGLLISYFYFRFGSWRNNLYKEMDDALIED